MATSLPKNIQNIKDKVFIEENAPRHTTGMYHPDAFSSLGIDNEFALSNFFKNFSIKIISINKLENSMIVDIKGIDTSLANALRRILLSEVPTMSIEDVTIIQNTSIIQDEVLCHRFGLLPINIDPRLFPFINKIERNSNGYMDPTNTLIFKINIKCSKNLNANQTDPTHKKYINSIVYSKDIEWVPQEGQIKYLTNKGIKLPLKCVYDDIIVAKLRPGQCIEAWMKIVKGIGRDHAKFSPVGTAFYRLLPSIEFDNQVNNKNTNSTSNINTNIINNINDAHILKNICPKNVFDLINIPNEFINNNNLNIMDIEDLKINDELKEKIQNEGYIKVTRPRDCSMCRACISKDGLGNKIKLRRIRDHFIFEIESIGQYDVCDLLSEAIKILHEKCNLLIKGIEKMKEKEQGLGDEDYDEENMEEMD